MRFKITKDKGGICVEDLLHGLNEAQREAVTTTEGFVRDVYKRQS